MTGWPWWVLPASIFTFSLIGSWIVTHVIKTVWRECADGRKPANIVSIILSAHLAGAMAYAAANLLLVPQRFQIAYAALSFVMSPIAFPALVMAMSILAEKMTGREGAGSKVRRFFMGVEVERRARRRPDNPTPHTETLAYTGPERRDDRDADEETTLVDKTVSWFKG